MLTSSQLAGILQGNSCGEVTQLNLGLEHLRSFGSALSCLASLVELYAQSNCLTSISGKPPKNLTIFVPFSDVQTLPNQTWNISGRHKHATVHR